MLTNENADMCVVRGLCDKEANIIVVCQLIVHHFRVFWRNDVLEYCTENIPMS